MKPTLILVGADKGGVGFLAFVSIRLAGTIYGLSLSFEMRQTAGSALNQLM